MQNVNKDASTAVQVAEPVPGTPELHRQLQYGEPVYNELMHFLIEEAHLLDENLFDEWLKLLAEDIECTMPVRQSLHRKAGAGFSRSMVWMRENIGSLGFKVQRLHSDSAFNEDPPSRTRRLITNVRAHETATPGEYFVQSSLLLRRNRGDAHESETLSARRDDVLRREGDGFKLARRTILMDQAVLGMPNLTIFL
jgi:3-phenylpropionate/cinnamic acid dioxygenase small subunit